MRFNSKLYYEILPVVLIPSITFGWAGSLIHMMDSNTKINGIHRFIYPIGYISIGIMTGITYPISFPALGAYVLYLESSKKQE